MSQITEKISQRSLELIAIIMMLVVMCVFIAGLDNANPTIATASDNADIQVNDDTSQNEEIVYQ